MPAGKWLFYNQVKLYIFVKPDEADIEYYITNQVALAAARILEFFGVTEKELIVNEKKESKETKSITEYF